MLEDRLLVRKFKRGSKEAFCWIYEKYRDDLLRLAISLLNEADIAEDIVHDVFTSFIRDSRHFRLTGSLKGYLATCVANRARNANRACQRHQSSGADETGPRSLSSDSPDRWITCTEEFSRLSNALAQLPYGQREAIILHLQVEMKFRQIAEFQEVPIKTAQSRYRIGLDKLRSILNGEVTQ